jgi:hypothetical protein
MAIVAAAVYVLGGFGEENCELWSTLNLGRAIALVSKGLRRKREAMRRGESP